MALYCVQRILLLRVRIAYCKNESPLTIDISRLELSCMDAIVEQQVDLAKGSIFRLWQTEPTPYRAEEIGSRIE